MLTSFLIKSKQTNTKLPVLTTKGRKTRLRGLSSESFLLPVSICERSPITTNLPVSHLQDAPSFPGSPPTRQTPLLHRAMPAQAGTALGRHLPGTQIPAPAACPPIASATFWRSGRATEEVPKMKAFDVVDRLLGQMLGAAGAPR